MTETINRGPSIQLGPLMGTPNSPDPYDGPGLDYQGSALPDCRYAPANKDGMAVARIPSHYACPYFTLVDQIPSSNSVSAVINAQPGTNATLLSLVPGASASITSYTATLGGNVNTTQSYQGHATVPLVPFSSGGGFPNQGSPVNVIALDFGFTIGATTAGSATVTVPDVTLFWVGQWIVLAGAGNAAKTLPLIAQVTATAVTAAGTSTQSGTITISTAAAATIGSAGTTGTSIGSANFNGPFPANGVATAVNPYWQAGVAGCLNPLESLSRGLAVVSTSGGAGTVTVKGYDIYGVAMTENIVANGTTPVYGKKAFKYILSATLGSADAGHNYSLGTSDVFGIHLRSDKWEYTETFWNATFNTGSGGWIAGAQKTATATTGDVRGTIQVSAIGGGSGYGAQASNNSVRFAQFYNMPLFNAIMTTPVNTTAMYGVPQF